MTWKILLSNTLAILKCICFLTVGIFLLTNSLQLNAYAKSDKSEISVSPSCGPKDGFNVSIDAKGLSADDIVYWELKDSDGETKLNGYFHTDGNGEVNDQTALEDVSKDHYKIYFGYDANNDGVLDSDIYNSDITIPCEDK
jgi:hypothetical protein